MTEVVLVKEIVDIAFEGMNARMTALVSEAKKEIAQGLVENTGTIKGWKHAGRDISAHRHEVNNPVITHRLKNDGNESGMSDAKTRHRSVEDAEKHHHNMVKNNPGKKIGHNIYVDGKLHKSLKEDLEIHVPLGNEDELDEKTIDDLRAIHRQGVEARKAGKAANTNPHHPVRHAKKHALWNMGHREPLEEGKVKDALLTFRDKMRKWSVDSVDSEYKQDVMMGFRPKATDKEFTQSLMKDHEKRSAANRAALVKKHKPLTVVEEADLDEARRIIIKVNNRGKRRRKILCGKGKKLVGKTCRPIVGREKMVIKLAQRKRKRTIKRKGAGFRIRANRLRKRALMKRKSMGLQRKKR